MKKYVILLTAVSYEEAEPTSLPFFYQPLDSAFVNDYYRSFEIAVIIMRYNLYFYYAIFDFVPECLNLKYLI